VIRRIALVSGVYDLIAGAALLLERPLLARLFEVPLSQPPIYTELNAVFLMAVAAGYVVPYRDPGGSGRVYLWVMGPFLKGAAALVFLSAYLTQPSPRSFLLFAASDGALALITLWALLRTGER
jgi:hypothetical protein